MSFKPRPQAMKLLAYPPGPRPHAHRAALLMLYRVRLESINPMISPVANECPAAHHEYQIYTDTTTTNTTSIPTIKDCLHSAMTPYSITFAREVSFRPCYRGKSSYPGPDPSANPDS
jgi:hypothetical protein